VGGCSGGAHLGIRERNRSCPAVSHSCGGHGVQRPCDTLAHRFPSNWDRPRPPAPAAPPGPQPRSPPRPPVPQPSLPRAHLQPDGAVLEVHRLGEEVDADGGLVIRVEAVIHEPRDDRRLAHLRSGHARLSQRRAALLEPAAAHRLVPEKHQLVLCLRTRRQRLSVTGRPAAGIAWPTGLQEIGSAGFSSEVCSRDVPSG
jgi:hypothetical protein